MLRILFVLALVSTGCLKDLRPSEHRSGITPDSAARGRALLERVAQAHGLDAWTNHRTTSVRMRDDWDSVMASMMGLTPPWDVEQLMELRWANGGFDGSFRYMNGEEAGNVLGMQAWATFEGRDGDVQFHDEEDQDSDARFMVPAFVYLLELPFRLLAAPVAADLGPSELFGRAHRQVYVSWSDEPSGEHDQFIVHIDMQTGLITMVEYTIREQFRFVRGTSTYTRHLRVGGVVVPTRMAVNIRPRENHATRYSHRVVMWNWQFDETPHETLWPDPARGSSGDVKPVDSSDSD